MFAPIPLKSNTPNLSNIDKNALSRTNKNVFISKGIPKIFIDGCLVFEQRLYPWWWSCIQEMTFMTYSFIIYFLVWSCGIYLCFVPILLDLNISLRKIEYSFTCHLLKDFEHFAKFFEWDCRFKIDCFRLQFFWRNSEQSRTVKVHLYIIHSEVN